MAEKYAEINFTDQIDGDTLIPKSFRFFHSDGQTPLDLSDVTPTIQIRRSNWKGKVVKSCVIGDGIDWVNRSLGQLNFGGFLVDWGGAGDYFYDIQFNYESSGYVKTYIRGKINVIDDVTI